jgi:hypothetical protein
VFDQFFDTVLPFLVMLGFITSFISGMRDEKKKKGKRPQHPGRKIPPNPAPGAPGKAHKIEIFEEEANVSSPVGDEMTGGHAGEEKVLAPGAAADASLPVPSPIPAVTKKEIVQGVIWQEILGRPRAKNPIRFRM